MEKDSSGAFIMRQGDLVDWTVDPNLSGSGFKMTREGDGDDSTLVPLVGFGIGDPTVVKARMGSMIRGVPNTDAFMTENGAAPLTDDQKANIANAVSVVNAEGVKVSIGSWPEGAPDAPDNH